MNEITFTLAEYISMLMIIGPLRGNDWFNLMCAVKSAGIPYDVFDKWNANDQEAYNEKENRRRWDSISADGGITPAYLVKLAREAGWLKKTAANYSTDIIKPTKKANVSGEKSSAASVIRQSNNTTKVPEVTAWDTKSRAVPLPSSDYDPVQDMINFIKTCYKPTDIVRIVTEARLRDETSSRPAKWMPAGKGFTSSAKTLVMELSKANSVEDVIGQYNHDAGVWIGLNPIKMNGSTDADVTDYRYYLVESDDKPLDFQYAQAVESGLPIKAIVHSGARSLHLVVKAPAEIHTVSEYKNTASNLYALLQKYGMSPDSTCKNPSRLMRLPGTQRGSAQQYLISTNIGANSYKEWENHLKYLQANNAINNHYGTPTTIKTLELSHCNEDWLINGLLRPGEMMEIIAPSKTGKSLLALQMCICLITGHPFIGFNCTKISRILYCNLEISSDDFDDRQRQMMQSLNLTTSDTSGLYSWHLRGKIDSLENIIDAIIIKVKAQMINFVVIDPVYILLGDGNRDENNNSEVTAMLTALQRLIVETGCAIAFIHHATDKRKSTDSEQFPSGASAFMRMYDSLISLTVDSSDCDGVHYTCYFHTRNSKEPDPVQLIRANLIFAVERQGDNDE